MTPNPDTITARLAPENIDFLSRIIESHGHVGVLSTVDPEKGTVLIRLTGDTYPVMREILEAFPFPLQIEE
jgi:hypothetical protein